MYQIECTLLTLHVPYKKNSKKIASALYIGKQNVQSCSYCYF